MKFLTFLFFLSCTFSSLKAQRQDYEIKVISKNLQNVKGKLQVVNAEGIAIIDYKGNYLIFKSSEIVKLKVRNRGLTIGEGAGKGTLSGLALGATIWSIDEENQSFEDMAKLTGLLTVSGAVIGTITGIVAEIVNTKFTITIDGDLKKYSKHYQKLEKYIKIVNTANAN